MTRADRTGRRVRESEINLYRGQTSTETLITVHTYKSRHMSIYIYTYIYIYIYIYILIMDFYSIITVARHAKS
jgi:hypothetical protein